MNNNYQNLYYKIEATTKTRFYSSRRLKLHAKLSTSTIVIISLTLILISLLQIMKIGTNIESNIVTLFQIFLSIIILVYSIIIDKNDYSSLADKMYSCGSRLIELKQKMRPVIDETFSKDTYNSFHSEYIGILKLYETHSSNDFRGDYFKARIDMVEHNNDDKKKRFNLKTHIFFSHVLDFIIYPVLYISILFIMMWII